jgi:SpoVK/Ycf46/Vps4 family AAA+-type ATPase|tara:strand:- start:4116 stop:5099 length:984 start_codon:yes stop_codon:yes gene_type:complete
MAATADQLKALLKSHSERNDDRFYSIALQVAAKEARQGHNKLAKDIKVLVELSQKNAKLAVASTRTLPFTHQPKSELKGLLEHTTPNVRIGELVYSNDIKERLEQVIVEQRQKAKLNQFGLHPRRKLLFTGSPGTGKTMSASMLATELKLPLYTIVLDNLITRYMGETAAKLRLIFDHIKQTRAVYLFDEFDSIGAQRGAPNDVGEIRRVLNSFLLFVEQDNSESLIVAATNHPELLDQALYRRFDDIIKFEKPHEELISLLIRNRLAIFDINHLDWNQISETAVGLSPAEITRSCEDAAKEAVLHFEEKITTNILLKALSRRHSSS